MFIRRTQTRNRISGEPYITYRLVNSSRVGKVIKQTTVLNLGSHFDLPQALWPALAHFAIAWVLAHRAVSAVIAGPRTLAQWLDYAPALDVKLNAEDEAYVDALVAPGHPSTPGFNDPAYPLPPRV